MGAMVEEEFEAGALAPPACAEPVGGGGRSGMVAAGIASLDVPHPKVDKLPNVSNKQHINRMFRALFWNRGNLGVCHASSKKPQIAIQI